ncbi:MAG: CpsB/CapC family capsule biosynthesis tyrosine phosphatase, partial [Crocinitomicaceae bacterium]
EETSLLKKIKKAKTKDELLKLLAVYIKINPILDKLIFELITQGYIPVLAHFERYAYYHGSIEMAKEFRKRGVCIQLNFNSIFGHYGPEVKKQAELLIDSGEIDFVATDCHRIEHLLILEKNLGKPYLHKLAALPLKNNSLK